MRKRITKIIVAMAIVFVFAAPGLSAELKSGFEKVPVKGMPTIIDIGGYWPALIGVVLVWVSLGMFGVDVCTFSGSLFYRRFRSHLIHWEA